MMKTTNTTGQRVQLADGWNVPLQAVQGVQRLGTGRFLGAVVHPATGERQVVELTAEQAQAWAASLGA